VTHSTQPAGSKLGTGRRLVPARARDIVPGSVLHTFNGDLRVDDVFVTPSGFRLAIQYDGPIRPFHPGDLVCLIEDGGEA
jgi:hypothetical protein